MSGVASPSDDAQRAGRGAGDRLTSVRADAGLVVASACDADGVSRLADLYETGGYRIKFPEARDGTVEAVLINTGGGVAGGDRIAITARAGAGSRLSLTSATAERMYRSLSVPTRIDVRLAAEAGAALAWLPQASLLFSGARVERRIEVDVDAGSCLVMAEVTVFGRRGSGETLAAGSFDDQWRVRRSGRLVFAEATRLSGAISEHLARPAVAAGAGVAGLLVALAPGIETRCDAVRRSLEAAGVEAGVSAWEGVLTVRLLGDRLDHVAQALRSAVSALSLVPLPTAWTH